MQGFLLLYQKIVVSLQHQDNTDIINANHIPIKLVTIRLQTEIQSDLHNENPIISISVSIFFANILTHYI